VRCVPLLSLLICCSSGAYCQSLDPPLLTENEAVEMARSGNRDVQKSSLDISRAIHGIEQARTNYFPQTNIQVTSGDPLKALHLTIPQGALGTYPSTGPIPGNNVDIASGGGFQMVAYGTLTQPLSQFYKIHLGVETARVQQRLAVQGERQQREKTVAQVRETYHQIVQTQAAVASDAKQILSLEETLRITQNDVQQGTALKADQLQVAAALAQQRITSLHDQNDLSTQREQLNELLGRSIDADFTVEEMGPPTPSEDDLKAARSLALQQRPEIRQADLQIKKAELDVRTERADYIPDISAQATYLGFQNVQFLPRNVATVGFSLQWRNPWDWGQRRAQIASLKDVTKQQQLSAEDARQQVLLDVDQRFRALQEARLSVDAAGLAQEASAERLRNLTNQYREQTTLLQDLLRQNSDFQQRQASYIETLSRYWSARADFQRAIGEE